MDVTALRHGFTGDQTGGETGDPIRRQTLHEELIENIRAMIFDDQLQAGTRIPERELCRKFGISRTPLREALKVLASEGLITLLPNRGAWVTELTPEDVDELFPVMAALEALSGELACRNASDADIAEVRALHYQMALHHARGEQPEYFRVNQQIHGKIMELAGNPTLLQVYSSLAQRIRRARYLANASINRWDAAMREHEAILDALAGRDGTALADLLKSHLLNKQDAVRQIIFEDHHGGRLKKSAKGS